MRVTKFLYALCVGAVLGLFAAFGQSACAQRAPQAELPLGELRTFTEVLVRVKQDYVESVRDETLLENAVRGMLSGLDPHSAYLDKKEYKDLQVGTRGEFGGLGIEVGMENGFVKVVAPIDDTPAARAGIQAGDLIIRIDGKPVKGMTLGDAVSVMRGKPGTTIKLTVVRESENKPFDVTIKRAVIKVDSVKSRILEPSYAYLRITQFQSHTGEDVADALDDLKQQSDGKLQGLVLDLRNNPGGVLNAAVEVADAFLTKGRIVYTKGRIDSADMSFSATPNDFIAGAPMVVLVNGGSASASEIVAGALQDHKRAVIMGSKTFGKGSVQTILPLRDGAAIKLTTARYYTPNGRSIQAEGIVPDVALAHLKLTKAGDSGVGMLTEADLSRHLLNGQNTNSKQEIGTTSDEKNLASQDYALSEALNLLKGLTILKHHTG
ncbi:S41 family peptidase [Nitrococcus mobilis]|uniref:Carboxyl-terminal protease n=1 Tax=Nitrococcus mobilis Nb-231 TaxID=314278 RepID=A4BTY5_9GAMM|nr:S41 family peptidase [Nitrococcus mobilis]EAR20806.1 carboxyl-terminal protease [Nitrococcus mobilis Nb-231]